MSIYNITTGKTYESIAAAARATGVNAGSISRASRGLRPSAGGYQWATASTAAEKRAATRAAKKAAGSLTEAQRERREWQRGLSEAKVKERKAAEKRAKEQAAAEERARKAAEREQKRKEREHKQAVANARRTIKELKRRDKKAKKSKRKSQMIDQALEDIGIDDIKELDDLSTQALSEIAGRGRETLDQLDIEEIERLKLLFGVTEENATKYRKKLKTLLEKYGEIREFVTDTQGDVGYAAFNLKSSYQKMILKSESYTEDKLQALIDTLQGVIDEAKANNEITADQINKVVSEWAGEQNRGRKKPLKAIKPR